MRGLLGHHHGVYGTCGLHRLDVVLTSSRRAAELEVAAQLYAERLTGPGDRATRSREISVI